MEVRAAEAVPTGQHSEEAQAQVSLGEVESGHAEREGDADAEHVGCEDVEGAGHAEDTAGVAGVVVGVAVAGSAEHLVSVVEVADVVDVEGAVGDEDVPAVLAQESVKGTGPWAEDTTAAAVVDAAVEVVAILVDAAAGIAAVAGDAAEDVAVPAVELDLVGWATETAEVEASE